MTSQCQVKQLDIEVAEERSKREEGETRASELERQLAEALAMKREAEEGRAEQEAINRDLREKGEQMAEQLREVERARIEARGWGRTRWSWWCGTRGSWRGRWRS